MRRTTTNYETPNQRRERCAQVLLGAGYSRHHVDMGDKRTARMSLGLMALFVCVFFYLYHLAWQGFGITSMGVTDVLTICCGGAVFYLCGVAVASCILAAGAKGRFSSVEMSVQSANCCEDLGRMTYFLSGAAPFFLAGVLPLFLGWMVGSFQLTVSACCAMVPLAANLCLSCMVLDAPRGSRYLESDFSEGDVGYDVFIPPVADSQGSRISL